MADPDVAAPEVAAAVLDSLAVIEERLGGLEERLSDSIGGTPSAALAAAILDALADLDERVTALTESLDVDVLAKRVADRLEQRFEVVPDAPA